MNDKDYMRLALQLAKKGCGWTSPQPDGGCRGRKKRAGSSDRAGTRDTVRLMRSAMRWHPAPKIRRERPCM